MQQDKIQALGDIQQAIEALTEISNAYRQARVEYNRFPKSNENPILDSFDKYHAYESANKQISDRFLALCDKIVYDIKQYLPPEEYETLIDKLKCITVRHKPSFLKGHLKPWDTREKPSSPQQASILLDALIVCRKIVQDTWNDQIKSPASSITKHIEKQHMALGHDNPLQTPAPDIVAQDAPAIPTNLQKHQGTLPVKIFYCYAHEDRGLRDQIDKHLGTLKRLGQVIGWYDREIQAGTEWVHEIEGHLDTANIILLLVSADFVNSDYCYSVEMKKALEFHRTGQARVLPIILRSVDWQDAPFASLQMLPIGAKPIMQWKDQDEALEDVAKGIRNVVSSLRSQKI